MVKRKPPKSPGIIEPNGTIEERQSLKKVVKEQGYPRNSTAKLWELIMTYHKTEYQNLIKMAALALAHPVHTADCERAFSTQNAVTTPQRNRLSATNINHLMRVTLEGGKLNEFDFYKAISIWRSENCRHIKL